MLHENVPGRFALTAHLLACLDVMYLPFAISRHGASDVALQLDSIVDACDRVSYGLNMSYDVFAVLDVARTVLGGNAPDIEAYCD